MREWANGKDRRRSLGSDYARAIDTFEKVRRGDRAAADVITLDSGIQSVDRESDADETDRARCS
jgi:hypothetical protein